MSNPFMFYVGISIVVFVGLAALGIKYASMMKNKGDYRQRVQKANDEMLASIRPLVSDKVFPPSEIVGSVLAATASKYNIDIHDMYDPASLASTMIKEIIDNQFLTSEQKIEFANLASSLRGNKPIHFFAPEYNETKAPVP